MTVCAVFALVICYGVFRNGNSVVVSLGAGALAGAVYWLVSRWIMD